ncbi:hypothetical protein Tco_0857205 [Tanacetum coccineum]|uniref:DUF4218 domain-containing protein n=1 Tax=Tanacetum coccineum TaxID=301880 RepID=A0ABQ5B6M2_9ASTR
MHIEKNALEALLNTLLQNDKTKDTVKARQNLETLKVRKELWLVKKPNGKLEKPHPKYSFTTEGRKRFCKFIKGLCARTLMQQDMSEAKKQSISILIELEQIFPPAFFDIMIHVAIHLPDEAILGGPIRYRFMKKVNDGCSEELFSLACGPISTCTYPACIVNGVKFVVHERDILHTTQCSGVSTLGLDGDVLWSTRRNSGTHYIGNPSSNVTLSVELTNFEHTDLSINSESTEVDASPVNDDNANANEGNAEDDVYAHVRDLNETGSNLRIETGNASLRRAFRQNGQRPLTIGFDYGDLGTFHPTGDYSSMLNSLMGETVKYLPLACEWEEIPEAYKAHIFPTLEYGETEPKMSGLTWLTGVHPDRVAESSECCQPSEEHDSNPSREEIIRARQERIFGYEEHANQVRVASSLQDRSRYLDEVVSSYQQPEHVGKGRKLPVVAPLPSRRGPFRAFPDVISGGNGTGDIEAKRSRVREYEDDHDASGGDHNHHGEDDGAPNGNYNHLGDNDVEEGNSSDSTQLYSDEENVNNYNIHADVEEIKKTANDSDDESIPEFMDEDDDHDEDFGSGQGDFCESLALYLRNERVMTVKSSLELSVLDPNSFFTLDEEGFSATIVVGSGFLVVVLELVLLGSHWVSFNV